MGYAQDTWGSDEQRHLTRLYDQCIAKGVPLQLSARDNLLLSYRLVHGRKPYATQEKVARIMGLSQPRVHGIEASIRWRMEAGLGRGEQDVA